jgi:hypothetical protein
MAPKATGKLCRNSRKRLVRPSQRAPGPSFSWPCHQKDRHNARS